jgi:hypothetical protein
MNNLSHLLKVTTVWTTILYIVCFAVVALWPESRELFMQYALHSAVEFKSGNFGVGYFISGLIIWNVLDVVIVWLFAALYKAIK